MEDLSFAAQQAAEKVSAVLLHKGVEFLYAVATRYPRFPEAVTEEHTKEVPSGEFEIDPEFRRQVLERARRKQLLSLRLERRQIALAKRIARGKSIGYQTLMRSWIEEGIKRELSRKE